MLERKIIILHIVDTTKYAGVIFQYLECKSNNTYENHNYIYDIYFTRM